MTITTGTLELDVYVSPYKPIVSLLKDPNARDDDPQAIIDATKTYIRDFDELVTQTTTPKELIDQMMRLHGERGNPYTLWTAAYGVAGQLASV